MSEDLVGKKRVIPEVGEGSPETGFSGLVRARKLERFGRKINKNKKILRREMCGGLAHRVHYEKNVDAFR
jgi:hypothetical protein